MRIFVTGGNGFIGSHLVKKLLERGDTVICLVRSPEKAGELAQMGAQLVKGDITDCASLIEPLRGAEAVVHLAAVYELGPQHVRHMRAINVEGARNVLETAAELGVPKIIHVSTVAVFGNTHGLIVDESYRCNKDDMVSEYERTKWEAHYEVAVPLQLKGAPIIITQPGSVTGAGDTSPNMGQLEVYLNRLPIAMGAKSGYTVAHVDDIADGHILALERGKNGQAYILAGEAITWKKAMDLWQTLTGIPAPKVWLPGWVARVSAGALGLAEGMGVHGLPYAAEGIAMLQDYTFWATADKAKRELGWQSRPVRETFREVLEYEMKQRGQKMTPTSAVTQ